MTSLNSRANIAEGRSTHHTTSHGANTMPFRHVNTRPGDVGEAEGRMSQGAVEIHISRVTEHDHALGHSTDKLPPVRFSRVSRCEPSALCMLLTDVFEKT